MKVRWGRSEGLPPEEIRDQPKMLFPSVFQPLRSAAMHILVLRWTAKPHPVKDELAGMPKIDVAVPLPSPSEKEKEKPWTPKAEDPSLALATGPDLGLPQPAQPHPQKERGRGTTSHRQRCADVHGEEKLQRAAAEGGHVAPGGAGSPRTPHRPHTPPPRVWGATHHRRIRVIQSVIRLKRGKKKIANCSQQGRGGAGGAKVF